MSSKLDDAAHGVSSFFKHKVRADGLPPPWLVPELCVLRCELLLSCFGYMVR